MAVQCFAFAKRGWPPPRDLNGTGTPLTISQYHSQHQTALFKTELLSVRTWSTWSICFVVKLISCQLDTFWAYPAIIQDCGEEVKADSWVEKFALGTASSELVSRDERQNASASCHFGLCKCKVRQPFLFTSLITGQFDAVRLPTSPWFLGFEMMRKIPPFYFEG